MRFPLALAVILIHINPPVTAIPQTDYPLFSATGIYNFVAMCISHSLTHIAVPTFFTISGFLFFLNMPVITFEGYKNKLKTRLRTLLIPYLLWNLAPLVVTLFLGLASLLCKGNHEILSSLTDKSLYEILWVNCSWSLDRTNFWGNPYPSTGPLDLPLWFIRDLMVVVLISPVIYFIGRYMKIVGLLLLYVCLYLKIWPWLPGLSINSIFYFSLGAYFAINKLNIIATLRPFRYIIWPIAWILMIICAWFNGPFTERGSIIYPLWIIFGVLSAFGIAGELAKRGVKANSFLVSSCFFLYAFHLDWVIPYFGNPLEFFKSLAHHFIGSSSGYSLILSYIFEFVGTSVFCLASYALLKRLMPRITSILSGGR